MTWERRTALLGTASLMLLIWQVECGSGSGSGSPPANGPDASDASFAPEASIPDAPRESSPPADAAGSTCTPTCSTTPPSTAKCVMGRCLVTLATNQSSPFSLSVNSTTVYWLDEGPGAAPGGVLMSVPIGGGTPVKLGTSKGGFSVLTSHSLAIDSSYAYWRAGNEIQKTALDGSSSAPLVPNTDAQGIAIDSTNIYWTEGAGTVYTAPLATGTPTQIAPGTILPAGIAVSNGRVYWGFGASPTTAAGIKSAGEDGGAPNLLYSDVGQPDQVTVVGGTVYWNEAMPYGLGGLLSLPDDADGGTTPTVVVNPPNLNAVVSGFAIDGSTVYFTSNDGRVYKAPLDGSAQPTLLASGFATPQGVAVDSASVYFTAYGSSAVYRLTPK